MKETVNMILSHKERPYQKLIDWKEAHELCLSIYSLTTKFPSHEKFGLVSQMRRSSYSVPTNIAEGNGKSSQKERVHFFEIASCSLEELHYQCLLSFDLKYITEAEFQKANLHIGRVSFLLGRLQSSIKQN